MKQHSLIGKAFHSAATVLSAVAGLSLLAMVVLIATGVVARYFFNAPILGVNEIVQFLSVLTVMLALPLCTLADGHVNVDIFDRHLGEIGRRLADLLARLLSGGVLYVLARRAFLKALDAHEFGDTTNMLDLPLWPTYALIALGAALCVAVLAFQFVILATGRPVE
ncbi:TRAP transporter small permease [Martelella sp. HB161492]|uniref:TRAP transporter small permease n=1 Tax=Martelella sp. HB161492 TaxID=2720726 RepID=UPI001AEDA1C3|nr:TRAP transporter small permease [Martelella sp. HB161492]